MEEKYTQKEMVDTFRKIRIDDFLIECLKVIDRDLIREKGIADPTKASDGVASAVHVIEDLGKQDLCNEDVDCCLQENIKYILRRPGVIKTVE
jgi:hypothetical protein